ncbi:hypothetical protein ZYGR_0AN01330 [Zygosaccharomyces rouxii]|uniref:37S ribosomal protein YMR-31, mitochondrial n=1 Tax=Zygosaccharomyces rouxii TaxID=4956 RepID=A0A1Q3AGB8_ZYGRO|nr:hypothetical protein ZYGR_0AN01330 [Zygosaccharomyces rouxii]
MVVDNHRVGSDRLIGSESFERQLKITMNLLPRVKPVKRVQPALTLASISIVSFFQRITQSVSKVLSKPTTSQSPKAPNSSVANSFTPSESVLEKDTEEMRSTCIRLAQHYTPMIRFVGGRHHHTPHLNEILPHPCAENGLLPNSKGTVPAGEFLKNLRPFKVIPYKSKSETFQPDSRYQFQQRPLQEGEKTHVYELSPRFQFKGISESEMEFINGGGAL